MWCVLEAGRGGVGVGVWLFRPVVAVVRGRLGRTDVGPVVAVVRGRLGWTDVGPVVAVVRGRLERTDVGSIPAFAVVLMFSRSRDTSDLDMGIAVTTLPFIWRYRVRAGTGRSGVSIQYTQFGSARNCLRQIGL